MPVPSTASQASAAARGLAAVSDASPSMPATASAIPVTGNHLYRPVRVTTCPETAEATSRPAVIGRISSPELVALAPSTTCKYNGMNPITPNIAKPIISVITPDRLTVGSRNSRSGSTGPAARSSTMANAASSTTAAAARPTITAEPHA
jgi:hypothetical protein